MSSTAKDVAVIGAGPAGLMAAEVLAQGGARVTVYDAMPSVGRKFLMAGRGGLNLTHSEALPPFLERYRRGGVASCNRDRRISTGRACGSGARHWGSRPSSAPAAGCFPRLSKPRPCCGPGCGGSMHRASNSCCAIAGAVGTSRAACSLTARRDRTRSRLTRPCSRSAARAGRGSAPTAAWAELLAARGVGDSAAAASQLRLHRRLVRHLPRPLRGPAAEGRRAELWSRTPFAARRSSRAMASRAARSTRCRRSCARRSLHRARRSCTSPCAPISTGASSSRRYRRRAASSRCRISCARR